MRKIDFELRCIFVKRSPLRLACGVMILATLSFTMVGCKDLAVVSRDTNRPGGRVRLENQADHCGVLIDLVGSGARAVTDESGDFVFADVPDGDWSLVARYPYFAACTDMPVSLLHAVKLPDCLNMSG